MALVLSLPRKNMLLLPYSLVLSFVLYIVIIFSTYGVFFPVPCVLLRVFYCFVLFCCFVVFLLLTPSPQLWCNGVF